ncbi:hypothetical protein [Ralstonia pickettii]|jgi:hypothetical protein|uniref:hypothetical protein n=1 Tax=Ralstonia pickettii TaxID=329 RepID=UPI0015F8E5D1|nr:hypothetical protein [Ralstonia pickettii]MBB0022643.1 hypothetical protein [Ralstonia pickettii]MBB0033200.1 hypothetical protein [Ralstonia pickettii]MBB0096271.1 hypothetical protein [Ralstonia pickettii]MBB0105668.1 hypothetical protein [Ralstonia pickettii]MBB0127312.1 hypothetical protein [Ralstonia pickettii]
MSSIPPKPDAVADEQIEAAHLREEVARLQAENRELSAKAWLLEQQISEIGPENARLHKAHVAALTEIARLKAPKQKGRRGRPRKDVIGTYEEHLVRTTLEVVARSMWNGGKQLTERQAAVIADKTLREAAAELQKAGIPGAFDGLSASYPADEESIYNAFRRGKRAAGLARRRQTRK